MSSLKRKVLIGAVLMMATMSDAQPESEKMGLMIQGYVEQADVIRSQGHLLVDVQDLARITNGSLSFEKNKIILKLATATTSDAGQERTRHVGFSPTFTRAAIEAMASIREWGGMLQVIVENGYPVEKAMTGNTIRAYEGRAADSVGLAAAAASIDPDYQGLELLRNEFNNVQAWAESFVNDRNQMRAVDLTTSEHPLKDNEEAQKIIHCGQFLAQMFAGGTFQDDVACH